MTSIVAVFLAAFVGGCKDEKMGTIGLCPLVVSTNPTNLAVGVPLDKTIKITFNEAMDPSSITPAALTLVDPSGIGARVAGVTGTLTYDASTFTMTYTPFAKLKINTTYTGTVGTIVKDIHGNALQVNYVWTFTTGATTAPAVVSTDPANNTTNVVLNKTVMATFSAPMDPLTITSTTFTVKQGAASVSGAVTYTGNVASFKPTTALTSGTVYTATITTGVKNVSGIALASNYVWSFTTGTLVAPTVVSTDPLNLATGVALNKVITANFSEAMNATTITTSSFTLTVGIASTPVQVLSLTLVQRLPLRQLVISYPIQLILLQLQQALRI